MTSLIGRFRTKSQRNDNGRDDSPGVLESHDMDATLSDEIETFEKLVAEQLGKLKARAAAEDSFAPERAGKKDQASIRRATTEPNRILADSHANAIEPEQKPSIRNDASGQAGGAGDGKQIELLHLAHRETRSELARLANAADEFAKDVSDWKRLVQAKLDGSRAQTERAMAAVEALSIRIAELTSSVQEHERQLSRQRDDSAALADQLSRLAVELKTMPMANAPQATSQGIEGHSRLHDSQTDEDTNDGSISDASIDTSASMEPAEEPAARAPTADLASPQMQEFLSAEGSRQIIFELAEALNVMEKLSSLLLRRHVKALGESLDKFPVKRLPELLNLLASEIPDERRRADFRERLDRIAVLEMENTAPAPDREQWPRKSTPSF